MPKYICCHDLNDYVEFMVQHMARLGRDIPVVVVQLYPEVDEGKVICEVETPSEADFQLWLERVNRKCKSSLQGGWRPTPSLEY